MKDVVLNEIIKEEDYQNFKKKTGKKEDYLKAYELEILQKCIKKF